MPMNGSFPRQENSSIRLSDKNANACNSFLMWTGMIWIVFFGGARSRLEFNRPGPGPKNPGGPPLVRQVLMEGRIRTFPVRCFRPLPVLVSPGIVPWRFCGRWVGWCAGCRGTGTVSCPCMQTPRVVMELGSVQGNAKASVTVVPVSAQKDGSR